MHMEKSGKGLCPRTDLKEEAERIEWLCQAFFIYLSQVSRIKIQDPSKRSQIYERSKIQLNSNGRNNTPIPKLLYE